MILCKVPTFVVMIASVIAIIWFICLIAFPVLYFTAKDLSKKRIYGILSIVFMGITAAFYLQFL